MTNNLLGGRSVYVKPRDDPSITALHISPSTTTNCQKF